MWRAHVVVEDVKFPQLIVKVQREKGMLLRLQFFLKKIVNSLYIVQISHYYLE